MKIHEYSDVPEAKAVCKKVAWNPEEVLSQIVKLGVEQWRNDKELISNKTFSRSQVT